jgi:hypothetical protein
MEDPQSREDNQYQLGKEAKITGEAPTAAERDREEQLMMLRDFSAGEVGKVGTGKDEEVPSTPWGSDGERDLFFGLLTLNQF